MSAASFVDDPSAVPYALGPIHTTTRALMRPNVYMSVLRLTVNERALTKEFSGPSFGGTHATDILSYDPITTGCQSLC